MAGYIIYYILRYSTQCPIHIVHCPKNILSLRKKKLGLSQVEHKPDLYSCIYSIRDRLGVFAYIRNIFGDSVRHYLASYPYCTYNPNKGILYIGCHHLWPGWINYQNYNPQEKLLKTLIVTEMLWMCVCQHIRIA